jgi:hypothetical protein
MDGYMKVVLTIEHVNSNTGNISVWRAAGIFSRVRQLGVLNEEVARCHVTFLRDDADAASLRVIADHLQTQKHVKHLLDTHT